MEDYEIIDLFFDRDEAALVAVKHKYGQRLFRTAMNILRNNEDAEECINDAMLKAWQAIPPQRPTMLGAFVAKIVRNLSLNKYESRTAARRGGGEIALMLSELENCIPSKVNNPEQAYENEQVAASINVFLRNQDKIARSTFVLRYFHGENIRAIGDQFQMSESGVKSLLFRTRKKLAVHLKKEGILL